MLYVIYIYSTSFFKTLESFSKHIFYVYVACIFFPRKYIHKRAQNSEASSSFQVLNFQPQDLLCVFFYNTALFISAQTPPLHCEEAMLMSRMWSLKEEEKEKCRGKKIKITWMLLYTLFKKIPWQYRWQFHYELLWGTAAAWKHLLIVM